MPDVQPNILLIMMDDMTHRALSPGDGRDGYLDVKTPHLDRLRDRGTMFTHAFHQGSYCPAVCIASRAMLHTGRPLWQAGEDCAALPLWIEDLRNAGYDTYGVGKWHNQRPSYTRAFTGGRNIFFGGMNDHWQLALDDYDPDAPQPFAQAVHEGTHSSELFADAAVDYLTHRGDESADPFLLYVAFTAPHDPWQPPAEYEAMYPADAVDLPPNYQPQHPFDQGDYAIRDEKLDDFPRDPAVIRTHRSRYFAMISHVDAQIGRILDTLETTGRADDTLVIFTGDHGLAVGEHGLIGKQNMYDHSVRVPLVFAGPGVPVGQRNDTLVYQHSVGATACEMLGVDPPQQSAFPSLKPTFDGTSTQEPSTIYGAYRSFSRMVRSPRYKLIVYPQVGREQLFDCGDDLWETTDRIDDPALAEVRDQLRAELVRWMRTTGDPLDLDEPAAPEQFASVEKALRNR